MKLTPKRLAWLRRLEIGPAIRTNNVGYYCMTAGWTEWNYVDPQGKPITEEQAAERFGRPQMWNRITSHGERLTPLGRKIVEGVRDVELP